MDEAQASALTVIAVAAAVLQFQQYTDEETSDASKVDSLQQKLICQTLEVVKRSSQHISDLESRLNALAGPPGSHK